MLMFQSTFLGVLMKPDHIEAGNQDKWFSLLQNQTESLEQGWFCVKLPDNEQLQQQIRRPEAWQLERIFFEGEPWISVHDVWSQLTIESLMKHLSEVLSETIANSCIFFPTWYDLIKCTLIAPSSSLPRIQEQIASLLEHTHGQLSDLPHKPTDYPVSKLLLMHFIHLRAAASDINPLSLFQWWKCASTMQG